jgi:hypothetical protein
MTTRFIESDRDRTLIHRFIDTQDLPFTVSISKGGKRSVKQNRLQMLWLNEIASQLEGQTVEELRAYCKLTIGVPILRAQNEDFRKGYDDVVKPLSYEKKLAIMSEPLDFPVSRLMTTRQATDYLEGIHKHFSEQGISLTDPGDLLRNYNNTPSDAPVSEGSDGGTAPTPEPVAVAAEPLRNPAGGKIRSTQGGAMEASSMTGQSPVDDASPQSLSQESGTEEEAPDATGPEPAHGEQAASSSELVIRNLMVECLDKFMALAVDPSVPDAKQRRSNVEFAKNAWKDALPQRLDFVKACFETADKVVKGEMQPAPAKRYLEGLL